MNEKRKEKRGQNFTQEVHNGDIFRLPNVLNAPFLLKDIYSINLLKFFSSIFEVFS